MLAGLFFTWVADLGSLSGFGWSFGGEELAPVPDLQLAATAALQPTPAMFGGASSIAVVLRGCNLLHPGRLLRRPRYLHTITIIVPHFIVLSESDWVCTCGSVFVGAVVGVSILVQICSSGHHVEL